MKGIITKIRPDNQYDWQDRCDFLAEYFSKWANDYLKFPEKVDFQAVVPSTIASQAENELNWARGMYLQLGFQVMIFIYDKYEPWYHTPEREGSNPLNTMSFTNVADTVNVAYVPPQIENEENIRKALIYPISGELAYPFLFRMLDREKFRAVWKVTEQNYAYGKYIEYEGYPIIPIEPR